MKIRVFAGKLIVVLGVALVAQVARVDGGPIIVVQPPTVVVAPTVIVPEAYVWDGVEYVGWYGNQYVYLGPSGWLVCDGVVLERFQGWSHEHPEYRKTAVRFDRNHPPVHSGNENIRKGESEHENKDSHEPEHENKGQPETQHENKDSHESGQR